MKKFVNIDLSKLAAVTVVRAKKVLQKKLISKGMGYFQARRLAKGGAELSYQQGGDKALKQFIASVSKGVQKKKSTHYKKLPKKHRIYQYQADYLAGHRAISKKKSLPTEKDTVSLKRRLLAAGSLGAAVGSLYIVSSSGKKSKKQQSVPRQSVQSRQPIQYMYPQIPQPNRQQYIRTRLREM